MDIDKANAPWSARDPIGVDAGERAASHHLHASEKRVLCLAPRERAGLSSRHRQALIDPGGDWTSADLARVLPP